MSMVAVPADMLLSIRSVIAVSSEYPRSRIDSERQAALGGCLRSRAIGFLLRLLVSHVHGKLRIAASGVVFIRSHCQAEARSCHFCRHSGGRCSRPCAFLPLRSAADRKSVV